MLTVALNRIVEWPVDVDVPLDGGKIEHRQFTARFELISPEEFDEAAVKVGDLAAIQRVVRSFSGADMEGGGAPTLEQLAAVPYIRVALVRAYLQCAAGAKRKNS